MPTPDALFSTTHDQRVETAEGIVALVQNTVERFAEEVLKEDAADVIRALKDRSLVLTLIAPKDDWTLEEAMTVITGTKDLRGWLIGRARDNLITHLVGRQGQADMIGRALRRFGPGKWKLSICVAKATAAAAKPEPIMSAGPTVPNGGGK